MRVLWFEISAPNRYNPNKPPVGVWQDALQEIVMSKSEMELGVAFEYSKQGEVKTIDGVKYYPINTTYNLWERQKRKMGWNVVIKKLTDKALKIVEDFHPDIIHVFGSEWSFGLVAKYTRVPVVIHMQGSIPPYNNAMLPPKYSVHDLILGTGLFHWHRQFNEWLFRKRDIARQHMEEDILRTVKYYMGRTEWDRNIVELIHPGCRYYYCSEALRPAFVASAKTWTPPRNKKFRIVTTGISTFWKGIETILRTAHLLKERGFDFEWIMVGHMSSINKSIVEKKEKMRYADNNCITTGFIDSEELQKILLGCDLYVHTAYIDNSPNAICEAQYLGLPIVATYVGGIPSLIENGKEGILVPANAPYMLAGQIIRLAADEAKRVELGKASRERALERHNPDNIYHDLLACYNAVLDEPRNNSSACQ